MDSSGHVAGASGSARLEIGTAPVNWNNFDLPNWRPVVPFPEILDQMVAAGYLATEWDQSFGAVPESLNWERESRKMVYTGAYRWLDFVDSGQFRRDLAELRPFLGILQQIEAHHLIVADRMRPDRVACAGSVPTDGSRSLDRAGYAAIASNLATLAEIAGDFGLAVHYHNHAGTYVETPHEVAHLISALDSATVDLCFDAGHYAYGGGDAFDFLQSNLPAIGYLHLKDVDATVLQEAKSSGWSFLDALRHYIFCPLGDGCAQVEPMVHLLIEKQFTGYVIIEQDTCRGNPTDNARSNLAMVRYIEGASGGT